MVARLTHQPDVIPGVCLSIADEPDPALSRFRRRLGADCPVWFAVPDVVTLRDVIKAKRLRAVLDEFRPDITHIHAGSPATSALVPLVVRLHCRTTAVVMHQHSAWRADHAGVTDHLAGRLWVSRRRLGLRIGAKATDVAVGVSPTVADSLHRYWKLRDSVRAIGNAADLPVRTATIRPRPVPLRIITVGQLSPSKRMHIAVECAAELRRLDVDFTWVIAGDGELLAQLQALAAERGVAGLVRFAGVLTDKELAEELAIADVFCQFSHQEGQGLALLEALAAGLPTLLTPGAAQPMPSCAMVEAPIPACSADASSR